MSTITYQKVAGHLEKLKTIYETLQVSKKELKEIEVAIKIFQQNGEVSIEKIETKTDTGISSIKKTKPTFTDLVHSLFQKKYSELVGTKINYAELSSVQEIINYIDNSTKTKVMKDATAIDLKLLYCLLTEETLELKGTKSEVYDAIKRDIRTKKRGKAFLEYV